MYKGVDGWEGDGRVVISEGGGWMGSRRRVTPAIRTQTVVLCLQ